MNFFNRFGAKMPKMPVQTPVVQNVNGPDWNTLMGQLQADPSGVLKDIGFNVPDEIAMDPQAMVMHLLQTGQVSNPMMQQISPLLNKIGIK